MLASFVRRLLVLMALRLEHTLVDKVDPARPLPRPKGMTRPSGVSFSVLQARGPAPRAVGQALPCWRDQLAPAKQAKPPSPARLYRMLDHLAAIVADPASRARRLAFHLARRRDGPLLAPDGPARIAGHWG
ncbi:MAG: hypothetical protein MUF14_03835, partial [Hyphomonadaceae bacterium]|nr:hypothetical protein [Hyphomonadaceae bacterium]